jgi:ABC-2 type transport system permease protein
MSQIARITRKEIGEFFASPAALLFLGAFLVVMFFMFFWMETFFSRNIADARPLFKWLPVLLIFLSATLTMRTWSEERRAGTIENLLTRPVNRMHLVLGKFLAGLLLVAMALALTIPLPITISLLGPLDWGPVIGGYLAALFLAGAYISIGVYMSAQTDNPIVAWILTTLVCAVLYLVGSPMITGLFEYRVGGILMLLGTGTRFDSVTRGVLDLRDLYFYASIIGVFLALNLFSLERICWAGNPRSRRHTNWWIAVVLTLANLVAANFWLQPISWARVDITRDQMYSLSEATERYLSQLQEPLLIRGYFSAKTHPLLAPLVPRIHDLLEEYAELGRGKVRIEIVDPHKNQALEEEAATKYGIRPIPFQIASRHQSGVVNSYFHIVVSYGDQTETLNFEELTEFKAGSSEDLEVALKNPEYSITSSIKKVLTSYRAGGNPFDSLTGNVTFRGYISPANQLPEGLSTLRRDLESVLTDLQNESGGKFTIHISDPDAKGGAVAQQISERYGFRPQRADLFDESQFWFSMLMERGGEAIQVPMPENLGQEAIRRTLVASLKRLAPGFLKTVALFEPPSGPTPVGYQYLGNALMENNRVANTDLRSGRVPEDVDLLIVVAPYQLDERQVFAIDQFLMQGGTVFLSTSTRNIHVETNLEVRAHQSGLKEWLAHYGLEVVSGLVMDPVNTEFPVPVERYVGSTPIQEIKRLPYPLFPDLRGDQLSPDSVITSGMNQLTVNWISPVSINTSPDSPRKSMVLLKSSPSSWISPDDSVIPDYNQFPDSGFAAPFETASQPLAVIMEGPFESYFKDRISPLLSPSSNTQQKLLENDLSGSNNPPSTNTVFSSVIERSPPSARIVLVGSNEFASDLALTLISEGMGTFYSKQLEFMQNVIDLSLEDQGLLSIRGRTQFSRTLVSMAPSKQAMWEYLNYGIALAGLLGIWIWRRWAKRASLIRFQNFLARR